MSSSKLKAPERPCRVCGKKRWRPIISFGETPLANRFIPVSEKETKEPFFPLDIHFCESCRLVSLGEVVDPVVLYRNYIYISSDSKTISDHLATLARTILERFHPRQHDLVVELGSNTGNFLKLFWNQGLSVLGVEPAENIAAVANANGIRTVAEFYEPRSAKTLAEKHGQAKVIIGRHVIAHIDALVPTIRAVAGHLQADGIFVMEVPYLLDLLKYNQFDTIYHEHLSYFSVETISRLFERCGLELVHVDRYPVHGGSIVLYAQHQEGSYPVSPSVSQFKELEEREALDKFETYQAFARRVEALREKFCAFVQNLRAKGLTIAGYGAPAKATTLMHYFGLTSRDIAFCTDNTPAKQGMLLPGTHIPVRADNLAPQEWPDVFLLFAWNYAREVIAKESAFTNSGKKFIVPIPEPRIVERAEEAKFQDGPIGGVEVRPINFFEDERGSLCETFRHDEVDPDFVPAMGTMTWTNPGVVRGPHEHRNQADLYVFAGPSDFQLVLWDNRPHSSTYLYRQELVAGKSNPVSILAPPGVVFGFENIGKETGLALNLPNRLYAGERRSGPLDEIRHELIPDSPFQLKKSDLEKEKRALDAVVRVE